MHGKQENSFIGKHLKLSMDYSQTRFWGCGSTRKKLITDGKWGKIFLDGKRLDEFEALVRQIREHFLFFMPKLQPL